jgi:hypothetical protein
MDALAGISQMATSNYMDDDDKPDDVYEPLDIICGI